MNTNATTTVYACKDIAVELDIDESIVKAVVDAFVTKIIRALQAEIPFSVTGFGKFFHRYSNSKNFGREQFTENFYENKIVKYVDFKLYDFMRLKLNGWVEDLKISSNLPKELARIAIKPIEIEKIRRRQQLEDQRKLGFRSELLFDEENLSEHDKTIMGDLDKAPTVEQIANRICINIDND